MSGVNKVILVGNLGKDPEVRNLENGGTVANFTIATTEVNKTTGKEITEWHKIVLWGDLAAKAQKDLHKGDMVYIEGKLRTRSWEKEGVTRYTTEIVGDNLTILSTRRTTSAANAGNIDQSSASPFTRNIEVPANSTDDLPF